MQIRCFRCGWAFNLSRETMAAAVANAEATGATHHVEHCPRCRQALKISIEQIRRQLPPAARATQQTQKETTMTTQEMPAQQPMPTTPPAPPMPEPMPAPGMPEPMPAPASEPMAPKPAAKKPAKKAVARKPAKKVAKKPAKKAAKKSAKKAAKKKK